MSKIYDALRRAEKERTLESAEKSHKAESSDFALSTTFVGQPETHSSSTTAHIGLQRDLVSSTANEFSSLEGQPTTKKVGAIPEIAPSVWTPDWLGLPSVATRGPLLEQFRALRSRAQEMRARSGLKSVLIASGLPQEGKSFVTVNLALALASSKGNRVLLIDGDMRRASVHKALGTHAQPGLSDYLGGKVSLKEILQRGSSAKSQKPLPNAFDSLTFIGAGGDIKNAADLSGNGRFEELLRWAEPHFEWIIVDSSPVNLVADSVNLARACDGVLFIVRSGSTRLESARRALEELKASKLLGVVLNAVQDLPKSHSYYGYANGEAGEEWNPASR